MVVNAKPEGRPGAPDAAIPAGLNAGMQFKGYTLDELRSLKAVNVLALDSAKSRLRQVVSPGMNHGKGSVGRYMHSFDTFMRYVNIAILAYGVTRRVSRFFRLFSRL